jgi:magnesium transporter
MPPSSKPDARPERAQVEDPSLSRADVAMRERNPQEGLRHFRELLDRQELEESVVSPPTSHRQDLVQALVAVGRRRRSRADRRFRPATSPSSSGLPLEQRSRLWHLVPPELDGAVLEASDAVRECLIADMDRGEIIDAAKRLDSDDIADLVPHLPSDLVPELLNALSREDRDQVQSVLSFPEGSVGALMDFDMVSVREDNRIEVVLRYLRRRGRLPHNTNKLMVVDEGGILTGVLFFESLLIHDTERLVREVMDADPVYFRTDDDAHDAALAFERYGLVAAPVVNAHRQLVGRLTVDAVMEQVVESAQQDMLSQVGLSGDEDLFANIWQSARNRWPWLAINLMTAFIASRVIGVFEDSIEKIVALAALMPIVASIGGNTGNQAVALTIRGLALDQIDGRNARYLVLKELGVSLANGALWGSLMGAATWLLYGQPMLGLVMAAAMVLNMLLAALVGISIPLGLGALGRDPAMGSSILLTFVTDAGGFFIFLGLASLVLAV